MFGRVGPGSLMSRQTVVATLLGAGLSVVLAACGGGGGGGAPTGPATTGAAPTGGTATSPVSGGGKGVGYDCPTLLTPAELDTASGLKGGTVVTTRRGDQGAAGEVMGVTECAIEEPSASLWSGHSHGLAGTDALANFSTAWDFAKQQGATSLAGVGTEALIQSTDLGVNGFARGANGVAVEVGVAWDAESTTEAAVKDAVRQILTTVLSRT